MNSQSLHIRPGIRCRTTRGGSDVKVVSRLGAGAQGSVFLGEDMATRRKRIVKMFHREFCNSTTIQRIDFQVNHGIHQMTRIFAAPIDGISENGVVGYVADFAEGIPLDVLVEEARLNMMQSLVVCLALATVLAKLHDIGLVHGDLRDTNVLIQTSKVSDVSVRIIDWDNIAGSELPPCPCVGAIRYMAPELCRAHARKEYCAPTPASESYAFAGVAHELLCLRHHLAGFDETPETAIHAILKGKWFYDPSDSFSAEIGGYPPVILGLELPSMFRRAFGLVPENRPTLKEWADILLKCTHNLQACHFCENPFFVDTHRSTCPYCSRQCPTLKMTISSGVSFVVNAEEVLIGRDFCGGSLKVSRRHAYLRRLGPNVFIQNVGRAGTFQRDPKGWHRIQDYRLVPVEHGDCFRLGDTEVTFARCDENGKEV